MSNYNYVYRDLLKGEIMARKRDKNGRFVKGDTGGPGRPPKPVEHVYWNVARTKCTVDDWEQIIGRAIQDAKDGDVQARRWLADIIIGDPNKLRERQDASDAPAPTVKNAGDVLTVLAAELAAVARFPNDTRRAAIVGQLADKVLKALEVAELAERLERIEEMLSGGQNNDTDNKQSPGRA